MTPVSLIMYTIPSLVLENLAGLSPLRSRDAPMLFPSQNASSAGPSHASRRLPWNLRRAKREDKGGDVYDVRKGSGVDGGDGDITHGSIGVRRQISVNATFQPVASLFAPSHL